MRDAASIAEDLWDLIEKDLHPDIGRAVLGEYEVILYLHAPEQRFSISVREEGIDD